ncbi:hypothetical protein NDU88_003950 [Pleurodeles waltl]|uniref:Uncharacterized protein n=1 Tax=Pleurodeles waltl TaxID=8319 RepID=A0AAV7MVT1_PLEWA|nr:hypothetical protein NDU88_003950 [Pleurodeles waltl]
MGRSQDHCRPPQECSIDPLGSTELCQDLGAVDPAPCSPLAAVYSVVTGRGELGAALARAARRKITRGVSVRPVPEEIHTWANDLLVRCVVCEQTSEYIPCHFSQRRIAVAAGRTGPPCCSDSVLRPRIAHQTLCLSSVQ